jgi:hypothetical protein
MWSSWRWQIHFNHGSCSHCCIFTITGHGGLQDDFGHSGLLHVCVGYRYHVIMISLGSALGFSACCVQLICVCLRQVQLCYCIEFRHGPYADHP